jgi:hypothetical protein
MVQFVIDLPTVEDRVDAIQITFTAGQTVMSAVTPGQRHAVQLLTAHLYENRVPIVIGNITAELPYSLKALIEQQKIGGWFV